MLVIKIRNMNMKFRKYPLAGPVPRELDGRYPTSLVEPVRI